MSTPDGFERPNLSRQKSGVLKTDFIERRPLCPPKPPENLRLTKPSAISSSS